MTEQHREPASTFTVDEVTKDFHFLYGLQRLHPKPGEDGELLASLPFIGSKRPQENVFKFLANQYLQRHRAYHGYGHISRLFTLARRHSVVSEFMSHLILWHDAEYIPATPFRQNEENSVRLMLSFYDASDEMHLTGRQQSPPLKPEFVRDLADAILATADHTNPDHDQLPVETRIFLDLDLYDLGTPEFAVNGDLIWQEFAPFVDAATYRAGRIKFFESLLAAPRIYRVFTELEAHARRNIEAELKKLRQQVTADTPIVRTQDASIIP